MQPKSRLIFLMILIIVSVIAPFAPLNVKRASAFEALTAVEFLPHGASQLTRAGDQLFFTHDDGVHGKELWRTDGTLEGTWLVKDITPSGDNEPKIKFAGSDLIFFTLTYTTSSLYRSDGTPDGTFLVKGDGGAGSFVSFNGEYYFWGGDSSLWKTDGTVEGTSLVVDIQPDASSSYINNLTVSGSLLYFWEFGPSSDCLWVSDGTEAGTHLASSLVFNQDWRYEMIGMGDGSVVFVAYDGGGILGTTLWKSDGTESGTVLLKDFNPSTDYTLDIKGLFNWNGTLYLWATDGIGTGLWKSDGTTEGTTLVYRIAPYYVYNNFTEFQGKLYFVDDYMYLWATDGTEGGTYKVSETFKLESGNYEIKVSGDRLFLNGGFPGTGLTLYSSDGTETGTRVVNASTGRVVEKADFNGVLYFSDGGRLWRTTFGDCPVVTSVTNGSVEIPKDGVFTLPVKKFVVTFSRDMYNPDGDIDPADVTNPLNYIVKQGAAPIVINSVTYTNGGGAGPFVVTVDINDGKSLTGSFFFTISSQLQANDHMPLSGDGVVPGASYNLHIYVPITKEIKANLVESGWVLESRENSNVGDRTSSGSVWYIGDDGEDRQYKTILSFPMSLFVGSSVEIVTLSLKIKPAKVDGLLPFQFLGPMLVDADIKFGKTVYIDKADFQSVADLSRIGASTTSSDGWYIIPLQPSVISFIKNESVYNLQLRLRFKKDDDNDNIMDRITLSSTKTPPVLVISYYYK